MKNKIMTFVFLIFIFSFSILGIIVKDKDISSSERRKLASFPEFEFNSDWIGDVDKYFLDHFVLRDKFRSLKAFYNYYILSKYDNNGIYLKDDYIFKSNYPTNKKSIDNFKSKILKLNSFLTSNNNVYMMVIPDKNYYLESDEFLHIDYDYIYDEISELDFNMIDVRDCLELSDYYKTDTHWRQEKLGDVVSHMSDIMKFDYVDIKYKKNVYDKFYGVYYGEAAIKKNGDSLIYLTSDIFDGVRVKYLENKNLTTLYNVSKLEGMDSYDVYLDGASSFIEIYNDNALSDKELVIFRDSFGSSLTPLLVNSYKKITVIDNRYIMSDYFLDYIEFTNQDVLFMYSTLLINESSTLKG